MSNIINFADHYKKAQDKPSIEHLAGRCIEELLGHWEKFAANNRLNDYFLSSTSSWSLSSINYLEDLSALSVLEQKIRLEPQIVAPSFSPDNALGWVAAFRMNGIVVATPFMPTEQYSRCFNILLYLKLKRELVTNGISVTT